MRTTTLWMLLIALALPLACDQAQETAKDATSGVAEAADAAAASARDTVDAAAEAAAEAREAASRAAAEAQEAASQGAAAAKEAASQAAAAAEETASDAAAAAQETASDAAAAAGTAVGGLMDDPVAKCSQLAAQGAWSEALEVCTKAHQAEPDNEAIEQALQQAKAAAE
jgi:hypothetical protein